MPRAAQKPNTNDEASNAPLNLTKEEIDALKEEEELETGSTPASDETDPVTTAAALKKELAETQRKLDIEAEARRKAEEAATNATGQANKAINSQNATQKVAIDNRVAAAKTAIESVKQQLKQAKATQDYDNEVELQDALTNARYELNAAEWDQKKFGEWEEAQKLRAANPQPPAAVGRKPGEYTDAEKAWIAAHPQFKTSKKFARITKAAAAEAEENGYPVDSDAYFNFIEESLREEGLIADTGEEPLSGAGRNTNTSTSVAAAPNRSGNGTTIVVNKNSKYPYVPNGFRIPAEWVQAATEQGFEDPREYANMRLEDEAARKSGQQ